MFKWYYKIYLKKKKKKRFLEMLHKANVSSRHNQYNYIMMDFNGAKSGSGQCLVVANHFGVFLEK